MLNPGFDSVAWQIIYRVEIMGIGMAIIYLVYDSFFNEGENHSAIGLSLLPLYILFLGLIIKYPGNKLVQNIVIGSNFLSLIVSFLYLAGNHYISTATIIDFSVSLLVVMIVYRGWERILWSSLNTLVLIFFIVFSILSYSNSESDYFMPKTYSDFWFTYVEIFSRLVFIFLLGITFLKDYDRQRQLVFQKNEEVNHLNKNLELLVKIRTEKLIDLNKKLREYSFLNSHKVRAPLARMMGIMNLINSEKFNLQNKEMDNYLELLQKSADELEKIITEMNAHLSEEEEDNDYLSAHH